MKTIAFAVMLALLLFTPALADWPSDPTVNLAVCTDTMAQTAPVICSDGDGGAIIVWQDIRNGDGDIYAQRVRADGETLWTFDGVLVCAATDNQSELQIIEDGSGGAITVWTDERSSESYDRDIYARKIDTDGNPLWTADGVPVCIVTLDQFRPQIASDGSGGAIIAWQDQRGGAGTASIYAQRVDAGGDTLWPSGGVLLCTAASVQTNPTMVEDGCGGAVVAWKDERAGDYDIYAQRVDADGNLLWPGEGAPVCTTSFPQYGPKGCSDSSGGAIITWYEYPEANNYDIRAQRIDPSGSLLWTEEGVPVCTDPYQQAPSYICPDEAGGAIIMWLDRRGGGNYQLYAQRVDSMGIPQWDIDGVRLCLSGSEKEEPEMIADGTGGAIITWYESRSANYDIYAQRIDGSGALRWPDSGVPICTEQNSQWYPQLVSDGAEGAIIVWQDDRGIFEMPPLPPMHQPDIYAQQVNANGSLGTWPPLPHVNLIYPNGGENLDDAVTIIWSAVHDDTNQTAQLMISLDYSDDAGGSWWPILQPLSEGFEGGIIPAGWKVYNIDGDSYQWGAYDASGTPIGAHSGDYVASVCYNAYGNDDWLITPQLTCAAGDTLKFWAASYNVAYPEDFEVRISTASADPGDFGAPVYSVTGHPAAWQEHKIPLGAYAGMDIYVAVRCVSVDEYYLYVDDFNGPEGLEGGPNNGTCLWDISELPYGVDYLVRVTASDILSQWDQDVSDGTFSILNPRPHIVSIRDVPGDQGREVAVLWHRSYLDDPLYQQITRYSIWRKYPQGKGDVPPGQEWDGQLPKDLAGPVYRRTESKDDSGGTKTEFWEYIGSQDAHYWEGYSYVAPTLEDSSFLRMPYFTFVVSAHDTLPYVYYDSRPDSGYSVDNITPAGTQMTVRADGSSKGPVSAVRLAWNRVSQGVDGSAERGPVRYRVYCDTVPGFAAQPEKIIAITSDLDYSHSDGRIGDPAVNLFYVITAVDGSDNESVESNRVGEFDRSLRATK